MNVLINSGRTVPFLGTRKKLVQKIINKGHNLTLTGYQTGYEKDIESLRAEFTEMPVNRAGLNPFKDIKLLIKYYKLIKKNNIEVVHSYTIKPNIFGTIAARLAGVKEIYPTLNGIGYAFTGKGIKAYVVRIIASILYFIAFKCSKKVFFHNKDDINEMVRRHLISQEKCILINGSGIDMDYFKEESLPESFSFVLISRLLKAKGISEYIKAAKVVKETYPEIVFKLVGPPDPNPTGFKVKDIQPFLEEGTIDYYGEQSDVRPFLRESSVVVLPSYREGVPHTILEAMATGRAILTTDVPGCRETVINGVNGFLVKPYSHVDLAEKMFDLLRDRILVKKMGKESLIIAKEKFEVNKVNNIITKTMKL
jgi:glycosyltransferase involved in cell wall biosynthesis